MASLREIRRKIKSVKSTQQITRAMKMVAAARVRKAQAQITASRPFAVKMEEIVHHLAALELQADAAAQRELNIHPFFGRAQDRKPTGRVGLVVVAGDKGLCGAFNANVNRQLVKWLRQHQDKQVHLFTVGRKVRDFSRKLKLENVRFEGELANIFPKVHFSHADILGGDVAKCYEEKDLDEVWVLVNEFRSLVSQRLLEKKLLPMVAPDFDPAKAIESEYDFEPGRERLLEALLPRYLKAQVYRLLLESQAAELAARMNAMESATKNAGELMSDLTLQFNRTRQALITKEIAELVGGAEALAQ